MIEIQPCERVTGTVTVPGSKSYTNRALLIAALADGTSTLTHALHSDDTAYMAGALRQLGVHVDIDAEGERFVVRGSGGPMAPQEQELFLGNSGTSVRFLAGCLTLGSGRFLIDGTERMRQRPIADLTDALNALGANTTCRGEAGCPPVLIEARGLAGGTCTLPGHRSSQYLSAILLSAPYAREDVEVLIDGDLVSKPYADITIDIMQTFGVRVEQQGYERLVVPAGQCYCARDYRVESDASNASYFFAAAAVTGGTVRVEDIHYSSAQGDVRVVDLLERMGCRVTRSDTSIEVTGAPLHGITADMSAMPDMVQTLAVVAAFAEGDTRLTGADNLRIKETDRLAATAAELRRLGAHVDEHEDGLTISPRPLHAAEIRTYDDHRMAMSFAVAGLRVPGVHILDPGCVSKTFPAFFDALLRLTSA